MSMKFDGRRDEAVERDIAELLMHLNRIKDPDLRATLIEFIIDTGRSFEAGEGDSDDGEDKHRLN